MISRDQALIVARADAKTVYSDLSAYVENIENAGGVWRIDYELADPQAQGGGPHYIVSAETGEVLSKRYEQ